MENSISGLLETCEHDKLIYYECYKEESDARRNEKYYKTTKGKSDLRKKLETFLEKDSVVAPQACGA